MASASKALSDVLFSEASLSHMAAAALLAKAGFRVTLLQGEAAGEVPPWALPPLGLLPPAGTGSLLEELFIASDLPPPLRRAFRTPPILFQVIWPGFRIDVASDPQAHGRALAREFGEGEAGRIERFEHAMAEDARELQKALTAVPVFPPVGLAAWLRRRKLPPGLPASTKARLLRPLSEALAGAALSEDARRYVELSLMASGHALDADPPLASVVASLSPEWREHALLPPPHTPELRDLLAVQLLKRGVQLTQGALYEAKRSRPLGWEVETTQGEELKTRALIEGEPTLQKEVTRRQGSFRPARTLRVVIEPKAVPVGMAPRGVLLERPGRAVEDGNLIFYCIEPPDEESPTAKFWATILAGEWASEETAIAEPAAKTKKRPSPAKPANAASPPERVRERVLAHLGEVMPFVDDYLEKSAWLPASAASSFLVPSSQLHEEPLVGAGLRLRGKDRYGLGRLSLPGLSTWGEIKAAFSVAALVEQGLRRK